MGIRTTGHRAIAWAFAALALIAVLAIPGTAVAADATFYYRRPVAGSTVTTVTPRFSVYVVDRYGIKYSTNFRLYVDGVRRYPKITYKSRYKKVSLAYRATTPLAPGPHKAVVKVRNIRGHWSVTSWTFTVPPPPPPPEPPAPEPMPITIESSQCHECHLDSSWHPMTRCELCHGPGRPVASSTYTTDDVSAHTPGCAREYPCHGGTAAFPHMLWTDCTACHRDTYEGIAPDHSVDAEPAHLSTATLCTRSGCHLASLTLEHYRRTVDGTPFACATCHGAVAERVATAIASGSTACESCHPLGASHTAPASMHVASDSCALDGCHTTDVRALHGSTGGPGCAACHRGDRSASLACATCHPGDVVSAHATAGPAHALAPGTCVSTICHVPDAAAIHGKSTGPGCATCHAPGRTPSTSCVICHPGSLDSIHPNVGPAHTAPPSGCVGASCHSSNTAALHDALGGPGCPACHRAGTIPTAACDACHLGDAIARHSFANSLHAGAANICQTAACHVSDVAILHATGLGCVDCHGPGAAPSRSCSACHSVDVVLVHPNAGVAHRAPEGTCVSPVCHGTDALVLHSPLANRGCPSCHVAGGAPSLSCSACHRVGLVSLHASASATHTAPVSTCVQGACHTSNASVLHAVLPGEGCSVCHEPGRQPSYACASCHAGDLTARHSFAVGAHSAPISSCVTDGCHGSNASTVHGRPGGPGCAACHAPGVNTSLECARCHVSDAAALHSGAAVAHAAPIGTCVQVGCHIPDVAGLHDKTGGPGCSACHAAGTIPTLTCSACHQGDLTARHSFADTSHSASTGLCVSATCHVSNVALTHATGLGCVDCHGPGRTPSLLCATCHTGTVLALHPAAPARHAATPTVCSQSACHGGDSAAAHTAAGGPGCAACHATGITATTTCATCHPAGLASHPAPTLSHAASPNACVRAGCHVSDAAATHTQTGGPGCTTCHALGRTPTLGCASCHSGDITTLHPNAAASHTGTTVSCVRVGCHVSDVTALHGALGGPGCDACHATGVTASVTCANCHPGTTTVVHSDGAVPHTASGSCVAAGCHATSVVSIHLKGPMCVPCHAPGVVPTIVCSSCHPGDTTTVHVPYIGTAHTAPAGACVTSGCHAVDAASLHTRLGGPGCAACHATGVTPSLDCARCHDGGFPSTHPAPEAAHTAPAGPCVVAGCHASNASTLHGATGGPGCAACHATGVTPSLDCARCHASGLSALHPSGAVAHSVNEHPCTNSNCHGGDTTATHQRGDASCSACHAGGPAWTNACIDCHSYAWASRHAIAAQVTDFHGGGIGTGYADWGWYSGGWILAPYSRGISLPCSTCHDPAGTDNLHNLRTTINGRPVTVTSGPQLIDACIACHGGTVNQWHEGCIECHGGGMGLGAISDFTGQDCSRCHQHGMEGWPHSLWSFDGATL